MSRAGLVHLPQWHAQRAVQLIDGCCDQEQPELRKLAEEVPLWLRRHGLGITLAKLRELRKPGNQKTFAATFLLDRVLAGLDSRYRLNLDNVGFAKPQEQARYVVLSAVVRKRADAFAMAAKAVIA